MTPNLWITNHPRNFWQCRPAPSEAAWEAAIARALPCLGLSIDHADMETVLAQTLGEGRCGRNHWELGFTKRMYYLVKPILPRSLTRQLRRDFSPCSEMLVDWPVEPRFVQFLWEILRQIRLQNGAGDMEIRSLWPERKRYALCLTHDIEAQAGQSFVSDVAALEESLGFRSSFNFIPERYKLNFTLMDELRRRGFEVGVHGLKHDGKLFASKSTFMRRAKRINRYLKQWGAKGFRSELTHRQPEWMQALDVEYDLSFFDTDPFEPIPGGTMSIWPFFLGHFVELPYTLVQDYSLTAILQKHSPQIWLDKTEFIEKYHGMVLVNSHPDYLQEKSNWNVYEEFLQAMKKREGYWHALPLDVARWWKTRAAPVPQTDGAEAVFSKVFLDGESVKIEN